MRRAVAFLAAAAVSACAPGPHPPAPSVAGIGSDAPASGELPPAGRGTLSQDDISIRLVDGSVQLLITPLSEAVTRTLADATYRRLSSIARAHDPGVGSGELLFLVSFFSAEEGVPFAPDDLRFVSRGIVHRPLRISPVTPGWGEGRLGQRQPEVAVFTYPPGIDLESELTVLYATRRSDAWSRILLGVRAERARIRVRGSP